MKKYILAIDQGTTSTRALLFDHEQRVCKMAQKEIKNFFPQPGYVEQDANEIWLSVLAVIADIFADPLYQADEVAAIGITNQRETTIIWDKKTGIPIHPAIVWQSRQSGELVDHYKALGYSALIKAKTGLVLDPYFSATKIRWLLDRTDKDPADLLFGTVDTWLLWKMTNGQVHMTDMTNAARTLLFNIHTLKWDDELLDIFAIPRHILPEVKENSAAFGMIAPEYFFNTSCPITGVAGDQQAALFGQSCFKKGDVKNTYGTGGFLLINTGKTIVNSDNGLLTTVARAVKGEVSYALEGSIFVSGSLIQWLRDGLNLFKDAGETEAMAASIASDGGVVIVPAFTGLGAPYWCQECQGAIFGLTRGVDKRHLVRAALEAMAFQSKDLLTLMEKDSGIKIKQLKVDGGASVNKFLLQFQSDILNLPVVKSAYSETTALGGARLAGLYCNFYRFEDFQDEITTVFYPQGEREKYEAAYKRYQRAVKACLSFK